MPNDLEYVLELKCTPEQKTLFQRAARLAESVGLHSHFLEIDNLIALEATMGSAELVDEIAHVLTEAMRITLNNFSIQTSTNNLELMLDIIDGINVLEEYEDFDTVLAICDSDLSDEERLAELLSLVTEHSAEDFLLVIDSVSNRLLVRIELLFSEHEEQASDYGFEESLNEIVRRYRAFNASIRNEQTLIGVQVNEGMPMGLEPALVFNRIEPDLYDLSVERTARELVAAALTTSAPMESVVQLVQDQAEELFDSSVFVSDVNRTAAGLIQELDYE